jgi:hypothetical protein
MVKLKAFEIYTFRNGTWKIDSVFDDRDLALMEADRIDRIQALFRRACD